nr:pantoate--beta-alanine ligase [Sphingomonas quercus]
MIRRVDALREAVGALRASGGRVALVPTMGALHAGHMNLVAEARRRAEHVVVSIFVNPRQFAPEEDLARYPRRESADARLLEEGGAAILWAPEVDEMYPEGFATSITLAGPALPLEGAVRPGHFDGVATVVAKLFNQVRPDIALFGEKDWQQLAVVTRMVADLDFGIEIVGVPIAREDDGLALSSRNAYLDDVERQAARALPRALGEAASAIKGGMPVAAALAQATKRLHDAGFDPVDYVTLTDGVTLAPLDQGAPGDRLLAAARLGRTRLIDNVPVSD